MVGSANSRELHRNGATAKKSLPKTRKFLKLVIEVNIAKLKAINFVTYSNERCLLFTFFQIDP